jgi:hypothetical protein
MADEKKPATPVTPVTPDAAQSVHAADHVEGAMSAVDQIFDEVKGAVGEFVAGLRSEADGLKGDLKLLDERTTGRMRTVRARLANFIGGNGGPPLDATPLLEDGSQKKLT